MAFCRPTGGNTLSNSRELVIAAVNVRQRRHSSLGMLTPVEFEARHQPTTAA
jgi:hypothetical protein